MKWTDLKTLICRRRKLLLKLISLSFDQKHPTTTIHCSTTIHHYLVCLSNEAFSRVQLTMQLIIVSSSFFRDFSTSKVSGWILRIKKRSNIKATSITNFLKMPICKQHPIMMYIFECKVWFLSTGAKFYSKPDRATWNLKSRRVNLTKLELDVLIFNKTQIQKTWNSIIIWAKTENARKNSSLDSKE